MELLKLPKRLFGNISHAIVEFWIPVLDVSRWENILEHFFKEEETQNKLEQEKIQSPGWNSVSGMFP